MLACLIPALTQIELQQGFNQGSKVEIPTMRLNRAWGGKAMAAGASLCFLLAAAAGPAFAQVNTRLLLTTGTEVPGHGGWSFGPFISLAMNGNEDIIFLTSLHSPRADMRAVVRSTGVSFSVVAFQGLLGPFPRTTYDAFSAPSMNDSGVMAFTATLDTDQAERADGGGGAAGRLEAPGGRDQSGRAARPAGGEV